MAIKNKIVFVLSDSLGETAMLVVRAALSQFECEDTKLKRIPYVDDIDTIEDIISQAKENEIMIVYTIVVNELKEYIDRRAKEIGIIAIDLLGPLIDGLGNFYGSKPERTPGLLHRLDEEYFKKIEAVEFAVKYDDGKDPRAVLFADIILTGVSRTSKTPLCIYLAHRGLKVVNIPLVPEVKPPEELFAKKKGKVIGLTIRPMLLNEIRVERLKTLGLEKDSDYAKLERIMLELEYAEGILKRIGCPVLDVTNKAVEETASKILQIYNRGDLVDK